MTITQIIGASMIAVLFVAIFIFIGAVERSWKVPAAIFGITLATIAFLALATALTTGAIA